MIFKDIKQNYPVYILDKQELTISQGKVLSVGFPRTDLLQRPTTIPAQTVIDITIENGDKQATYTIPENLSITYAGNVANDVDGYEGIEFCRFIADIMGKHVNIDWNNLMYV